MGVNRECIGIFNIRLGSEEPSPTNVGRHSIECLRGTQEGFREFRRAG